MQLTLFGKARSIESQVDEFLNILTEAGLVFEQIIDRYITHGADESFEQKRQRMRETKQNGNKLARVIGKLLYTDMLIPDLRSDVLSLLQDLSYVLDRYDEIAASIDVERPDLSIVDEGPKGEFKEVCSLAVNSVESAVAATRAFFKDMSAVDAHVHKIGFYESEVDQLAMRLKKDLFATDLPLDRKMQLRYFIDMIDDLADDAENVGDWIAIYTIKRSL
jgi:predicted phosphate transport protein (TIGR00153 family)